MSAYRRAYEGNHGPAGGSWTAEQCARLALLWGATPRISAGQIARMMGLSKNAIVGKAHRMGLPGRPSPIRTAAPKPRSRPAALSIVRAEKDDRRAPDYIGERYAAGIGPAPKFCQWIEGEPSADDACKCGARVVLDFSYCADHLFRAYLRPAPQAPVCGRVAEVIPAPLSVGKSENNTDAQAA